MSFVRFDCSLKIRSKAIQDADFPPNAQQILRDSAVQQQQLQYDRQHLHVDYILLDMPSNAESRRVGRIRSIACLWRLTDAILRQKWRLLNDVLFDLFRNFWNVVGRCYTYVVPVWYVTWLPVSSTRRWSGQLHFTIWRCKWPKTRVLAVGFAWYFIFKADKIIQQWTGRLSVSLELVRQESVELLICLLTCSLVPSTLHWDH